jgi:hypothetical protein
MEDKSSIYETQIEPLVQQIGKIAQEHGIPFVLLVQTSDGDNVRSAYIPASAHKEMRQLWQWLEQ